ncbi:MAG: type IV pilus twitching motility protein PilT [Oligoflexales bacterium]
MDYNIAQLLKALKDEGGSDLHIAAGTPPRLRIHGNLMPLKLAPLTPDQSRVLCLHVLSDQQKTTLEKDRQVDLAFTVKGLSRFRANIFYDSGKIAGAFRIIANDVPKLMNLDLPPLIEKLCHLPRGLVLVTGQTGSGKSTTLAAMVDHINETRSDHIVTIEDPIEYIHVHKNSVVNQREVGDDANSFAAALKAVLRQDPDIIMVGELRDLETISAALTAAETGHLVFATLHTNNCVSSLNRIIDAFPPHQQNQVRAQLSMTLEAVLSQTLVPSPSRGRVLACELMRVNAPIRSLISEGKFNQIYSAMQAGQVDSGMQTMNQSLFRLFQKNFISREQALAKAHKPDEFLEMIGKGSSAPSRPSR